MLFEPKPSSLLRFHLDFDCVIIIHYSTVYYPASQVYSNHIQMTLKSKYFSFSHLIYK